MNKTISRLPVFLLHFGIWLFIFVFPILFVDYSRPHPPVFSNIFDFLLTFLLFYINYFILIKRFLFKRKYVAFLLSNVLIILLLFVATYFYIELSYPFFQDRIEGSHPEHMFHGEFKSIPLDFFIFRNLLMYSLSCGAAVAIRSTLRLKEEEALRKKIENEHLKSEITYLKYQLQPHFFFNTLNNIYALIDRKPEMAKEVLHNLSKLLRYVLYHAEDPTVLLQSEIYFLKTYINLMQIRLSSNINVSYEFPDIEEEIKVPPLLFITLVENAYKHGIDATLQGNISIKMQIDQHQICFSVTNTCSHPNTDDQTVSGIGLDNLRKRSKLLYKDSEFKLTSKQTENEYFSELIIPLG
jgi:two-component system, LytTR family, sensor histidine kinase AlgZ